MVVLAAARAARADGSAARRRQRRERTRGRDPRAAQRDARGRGVGTALAPAGDPTRGDSGSDATPAPPALSDRESDLPAGELKRLRGVAAWAGDTLKLTVYNGTQWRVTELHVKISRFKDDDFVEDARPVLLVPPGQSVDAGVADLLNRVAPDRKKAGLNPADTGPFEGKAGPQPENFRWEIESARGYSSR